MKKFVVVLSAAVCLLSCQRGGDEPAEKFVKIDPVITRATEVNFENGDRIGLTVIRANDVKFAENSPMTFANGVFSGDLKWYTEGNEAAHFSAYYPYASSGAPSKFAVAADQSAGYEASDLLAASKSDVLPTANSVSMVFRHMMSKIVVNVDNQSGADITSITLKGSIPVANVDFTALTVEADESETPVDIKTQQVTANALYRAIVVPQTVAFKLSVTTSAGKTLEQNLVETALKQGGQYGIDVRVIADNLQVSISGEIENWSDEGKIDAEDSGTPEVPFEEHEGYFIYDGATYPTVTFTNGTTWMATPLRYIPEGYTPSTDPLEESHIWYPYQTDGTTCTALTDDASVAANGYLYDLYAALGGIEITPENHDAFEGAQGICPPGWHIPSRAEYLVLCGSSTKAEGETSAPNDDSALFYDGGYKAGKVTLFNAGGFNYVFSGVRMQTSFTATPSYQKTATTSATCSVAEWIGLPSLSYYMTSTAYKPVYDQATGTVLTNIQFFGMMSTFTASYTEGKLSLAYISVMSGMQLRCVKN